MSDTKISKKELREQFYWSRWPLADEFVDYVYETYHGGADSWEYSDQDAYEQSRKLAAFYEREHRLPTSLGEWMPGWE